jgi:Zn-dependent peptidase ImmA (M78 family)/transcriptional regulator with XRE-family HTH domain
MKAEPTTGIQPAVLRWARESIGMSVEDVALKLKRPPQDIRAWESADGAAPTYAQLETLAYKVLKRPLAVFFLPEPPQEVSPKREFRTLPDAELQALHVDTHMQVRKAHAFQLTLREIFDGSEPAERQRLLQARLNVQGSVAQQASVVRESLGVSLAAQIAWRSDEVALKRWREAVEGLGIFVFKAPFKQKEISGFCLPADDFPLIYLNNSTTKTRQTFSLLHELAHLLLNMAGISKFDSEYIRRLPTNAQRIEVFCNQVAAEVLMPSADFAVQAKALPNNVEALPDHVFADLGNRYGVSREAVLRRFLDLGRVGQAFYEVKAKFWAGQKKAGSGGDWYASQNTYLSERLAREVVSRHYRNQISVEQASEYLGIKAKNFAGLEQRILQGAAA